MTKEELHQQIQDGVQFYGFQENGVILGVMGIQDKGDVTLIRHAYVRTTSRSKGIGSQLLTHLISSSALPILIGAWADAAWAVKFYQHHGFRLLPEEEKNALLVKYWGVPPRQIETSVVLASPNWQSAQ